VKYLRTMLAAVALLLVFAFPAWGQETVPEETTAVPEETTVTPSGESDACQNPQEVLTVGPTTETLGLPLRLPVMSSAYLMMWLSTIPRHSIPQI